MVAQNCLSEIIENGFFSVFAFKQADFINACHINDKYGRFTLWLLKEIFTLATK